MEWCIQFQYETLHLFDANGSFRLPLAIFSRKLLVSYRMFPGIFQACSANKTTRKTQGILSLYEYIFSTRKIKQLWKIQFLHSACWHSFWGYIRSSKLTLMTKTSATYIWRWCTDSLEKQGYLTCGEAACSTGSRHAGERRFGTEVTCSHHCLAIALLAVHGCFRNWVCRPRSYHKLPRNSRQNHS